MKRIIAIIGAVGIISLAAQAQVLLSGGLTYSQNFDSLASTSGTSTTVPWADNTTLLGWYASRAQLAATSAGGVYGPTPYTSYRVGIGSANNGWIWGFGSLDAADRAFGSLASGSTRVNAYGVRIQNDTANALGDVRISYTGEQWRNGGNTAAQAIKFTYRTSSTPITDPAPFDQNVAGNEPGAGWTPFTGLDFSSPTVGATAAALDGNAAANRTVFSSVVLTGVSVNPGDEIFLRWYDIDDSGNDHGLSVDDLTVSFSAVPEPSTAALVGLGLLALSLLRRRS
jgi:uncharacterized protein